MPAWFHVSLSHSSVPLACCRSSIIDTLLLRVSWVREDMELCNRERRRRRREREEEEREGERKRECSAGGVWTPSGVRG